MDNVLQPKSYTREEVDNWKTDLDVLLNLPAHGIPMQLPDTETFNKVCRILSNLHQYYNPHPDELLIFV